MSSEREQVQARLDLVGALLERHMATAEPKQWPAKVFCKCGMEVTAISLCWLTDWWFRHVADEAEKEGRQRGFKEAKEMAAQVADDAAVSRRNEANRAHYDHGDEQSASASNAEADIAEDIAAAIRALESKP